MPTSNENDDPSAVTRPQRQYSQGEWIFALIIFVIGFIAVNWFYSNLAEKDAVRHKKERERLEQQMERNARNEQYRLQGERSRDAFDQAMRDDAGTRRKALEKASLRVTTSNKHGVRIDHYHLKRGGVITCTTTISGNSPAIFSCDGVL